MYKSVRGGLFDVNVQLDTQELHVNLVSIETTVCGKGCMRSVRNGGDGCWCIRV